MIQSSTALMALAAFGILAIQSPAAAQPASFDFGNDAGEYAGDGECDDLRFQGEAMADIILTDEIGRDASDCSAAFEAGMITFNPLFVQPASDANIIFGDDASEFASDGECDDVRFKHEGSGATIYLAEDVGHDASDCRAGFEAGWLSWQGHRADLERGVTAADIIGAGDS